MLPRLALVLLLSAGGGAQAAVISQRPDSVTVTIYHEGVVDTAALAQNGGGGREGLALITETRSIDLPAGPADIQFRGVADSMVPQTADVSGLPDGVTERNFDYDLLSPGALLARSVGRTVRLIRTDRHSGKTSEQDAQVLSGPGGTMLGINGKYEALNCSGLPERLVFDRIPDGLIDTPTLTVRTNVARRGRYTVTLRYIALGLNWSADYVAHIGADDRTLDLSGWITLANFAGTSFADAPVEVIAGHVETGAGEAAPEAAVLPRNDVCWPTNIDWARYLGHDRRAMGSMLMGFAPPPSAAPAMEAVTVSAARKEIEARDLGDYKLYPLPEPTTVAARQTKQVQFLDRRAVPFARIYSYRMSLQPPRTGPEQILPAAIHLRLENTARGGLGRPLPAGSISAMAAARDGELLAGRDRLEDVAVGLPLEIGVGETMTVRAQAQVTEASTIEIGGVRHSRTTRDVTLINDKAEPATFEWRQAMDEPGATLVSESRGHGMKNGDLLWALTLAPGARTQLRYTIDVPQ